MMSDDADDGNYNAEHFHTNVVVRSGWTIEFALWVRRWILTIGASIVVLATAFDIFWILIWVSALAFDVWITPRAIDLRLSDDQILEAIREKRRFRDLVGPDRRDKVLGGILIALCLSAIICGCARLWLDAEVRDLSPAWRFARGAGIGISLALAGSFSWFGFEILTARRCPAFMAFGGGASDAIALVVKPLQSMLVYLGGLLIMVQWAIWPEPKGFGSVLLIQLVVLVGLIQVSLLARNRIRAI